MTNPIPFPRPYAPDPVETRTERAARLRPLVAAQADTHGLACVSDAIGIPPRDVRAFLDGLRTPLPGTLDAYEDWLRAGGGAPGLAGSEFPDGPAIGYDLPPLPAGCRARGGQAPRSPGEWERAAWRAAGGARG